MSAVARLVAAIALVSLGAGAFFLAASTGPTEPPAPSPSPTASRPPTIEALLSGMVTEEVEPGVLRIVNDGKRILRWVPANPDDRDYCCHYENNLGFGPDGSPWFFRPEGFFELGSSRVYPGEQQYGPWGDVGVAHETGEYEGGTPYDVAVLWGSDGDALLQAHVGPEHDARWGALGPGGHVAVDPSGAAWVTSQDLSGRITLAHKVGPRQPWTAHDFPDQGGFVEGLWATDDGVWLLYSESGPIEADFSHLWRFDGSQWHDAEDPTIDEVSADVGQDGTIWLNWAVWRRQEQSDGWSGEPSEVVKWSRHDDDGWTTFDAPDDLPLSNSPHDGGVQFDVALDGSLWFAPHDESAQPDNCDGLARFDGVALRRFLPGLCLYNLGIGPDGSVWALAGADYWEEEAPPVETYVIPAEVAMAER